MPHEEIPSCPSQRRNVLSSTSSIRNRNTSNMELKALNNGFGPLSRQRSDNVLYGGAIAAIMAFPVLIEVVCSSIQPKEFKKLSFRHAEPMHLFSMYCAMASSLIFGEIVRRLTLFIEEFRHANERYQGSKVKALQTCMTFGNNTKECNGISRFKRYSITCVHVQCLFFSNVVKGVYITFAVATLIPCLYHWNIKAEECFPLHIYIAYASVSSLVMYVIGAKKLAQAEMSHLTETENKNIADGLAWSYYYGYLKLVLPHLQETVDKAVAPDYEIGDDDMCSAIKVRKLFIIISKSCNCYSGLIKADEDHIQKAGRLPAFYMTRAGVELRPYQHSLYRVEVKGKPAIHVILEFATPLLAMNDMSEDNISHFSVEDRDTQVMAFYNKLKYILEHADQEIRGRYELVLISDVYSSKGQYLSDVIYDAVTKASLNIK